MSKSGYLSLYYQYIAWYSDTVHQYFTKTIDKCSFCWRNVMLSQMQWNYAWNDEIKCFWWQIIMKVNQTGCRKMCSLKEALCDVV